MTPKILLVEDSKEISRMVMQSISGPLLGVDWTETITEAKEKLKKEKYQLLLLDIELPDGNGIEFCSEVQMSYPNLPIFMLTAHDNLSEKVLGFSAGADDYITKPFNPLELKARVDAKLKKQEIIKQTSTNLSWKELKINKSTQEVEVINESEKFDKVDLTALEFKLLTYFADQPEVVIDRDTMLNDIWGEDVHVYSRSVDTHVSKLRKKLGAASHVIESVHGVGYKFVPTNI